MGQQLHVISLICAVGMCLALLPGCGGPPVVESEQALSTVDALYTAVTSKRTDLVDQTEKRLKDLRTHNQLSDAAMKSLDAIITQARACQWQQAAERLDHFIRNQPPHKQGRQ